MSERSGTPDYFGGAELVELFRKASASFTQSAEKLERLAADPRYADYAPLLGLMAEQQREFAMIVDMFVEFAKRNSDYINLLVKGYMVLSDAFEAINKRLPDELRVAKLLDEISKGEAGSEASKRVVEAVKRLIEEHEKSLEQDLKEGRIV